ncbi:MAG: hypothetical protein AB7S57_10140 [Acetobacteraceae bacterium]
MERGHVDEVTREHISGWAADPDDPGRIVEVSIFRDGVKVTQVACDIQRSDLLQSGAYGTGHHGFRYRYPAPLPPETEATIAIRFTESGRLLGNGQMVMERGVARGKPIAAPPVLDSPLVFPAPTDPQSLAKLFSLYDGANGLYDLLCRLDFRGIKPSHLRYSVFEELTSLFRVIGGWETYAARDELNNLLHSQTFQENIIPFLLNAFPDRRRLLFVHIPKCAGSDLSLHLSSRTPSIEQRWAERSWSSPAELFRSISHFAREVAFFDRIFIRGHVPLDYYCNHHLIRPSDHVFTIVRDPLEISVSQANYVLTKIRRNVESGIMERDTQGWMQFLGLTALPTEMTAAFASEYSRKILYNTDIVEPNSICRWLGGGTAEEVIRRLAQYDVELTDTGRYNDWLTERWGIVANTRQNESEKFVTLDTLGHQELNYLARLSPEDLKLFDIVGKALAGTEKPSVTGSQLLEYLPSGVAAA